MNRALRVLLIGALPFVSAAIAISAAVVTRMDQRFASVTWPLGLILALAAALLYLRAVWSVAGRAGRAAAGLGWAAGLVICLWPKPEGDIVIGADWIGMLFVMFSVVAVIWILARSAIPAAGERSS